MTNFLTYDLSFFSCV